MRKLFRSFSSINPVSITTCLTVLILILFLIGVPFLDLMELKTLDLRFKSRGVKSASSNVVLAVIDEKSVKTEGRWPWPRSKISRLIDILSRDGAKVIGFDVIFAEPDENTNLQFIDQFGQKVKNLQIDNEDIEAFLQKSKLDADNDLNLAEAIKASDARVVLGYFFHMSQADLDYTIGQKDLEDRLGRISNSRYPIAIYEQQHMEIDPFIQAYAPQPNIETLTRASDSAGFFNMLPDQDGVVRWIPLIIKCGPEAYASLSVQSVWHYLDQPQLMVRVASYGIEGIRIGEQFIPTDENGQMLINYVGPEKSFPHYPITDILQEKFPDGAFKNKIVLVGATAVGIYDMRNTPFSAVYPGVEIHATAVDNILRNNYLNKPKWTMIYDALAILILSLLVGIVVPRLSALKGMFYASGLFVLHIFAGQWLFTHAALWVNIVYPLVVLVLLYTSLTIYHYLTEERERKKIRGAFSYYVSRAVVNEMLKDPEKLKLGGDKKDLSVLFSDIRGFTTISEGMTPEELVHLLNEYLTIMTDIVFKYDGTLDKYMGDAIMAVYGAPLEQRDHPHRACYSALEMMEGLRKLNEKWTREGKTPLDIGIGINTGMMMVGNMGSEQRFDYTVMGDAVNLGSRLEGANKNYQTNILISEYTYERVKDKFVCMELDSVRVKGKTLPVSIYQLVGPMNIPEAQKEAVKHFHQGLELYKQQKWDEAIEVFQSVTAMDKNILAAGLYIQRSLELKINPPPPDWDGVFTMESK
ncbi:MAG: adenylate/guanylate cyclase domain-containing protein [Desulfobacteraceae bacterium]|jgi:adenylate cyclase